MVFNQSIYHSLKILAQSSVAASPSGDPSGSGPSPHPSQRHGSGATGSSKGSKVFSRSSRRY